MLPLTTETDGAATDGTAIDGAVTDGVATDLEGSSRRASISGRGGTLLCIDTNISKRHILWRTKEPVPT